MLKTARKYGVAFAPAKLSQDLKTQLPAFYHLGAAPRAYVAPRIECLIHNHLSNAKQVKHLLVLSARLRDNPGRGRHNPTKRCACPACALDRRHGCTNPHRCAKTAAAILQSFSDLTNMSNRPHPDNLTLTHRRLEKNKQAHAERGTITFDPTLTAKNSLAECFRVFLDPKTVSTSPAYRLRTPATGLNLPHQHITVYTDGSCLHNGKANARAGSGIYVRPHSRYNRAIRVPGPDQSNQAGELTAILVALQTIPTFRPITFITD
ncbi:hypothetical protein GLOTRDRAFT_48937, partial [Gloeophyllum trabeum ATCC 11539]